MHKLQNSDDLLNFWILETIEGGFLIGSGALEPFILDDADFEFYLLQVNEIGQDDWAEITYSDFLKAEPSDIEQHINIYLTDKYFNVVEQYNLSKLSAKVAPFPDFDSYESNEGHQRPTFSYHKIHIKTK